MGLGLADIDAGWSIERRVKLGISLVPEGRQLFSSLSVKDNLALGAYLRHRKEKKEIQSDYISFMELFPVLEKRMSQLAGTLSGGEQQMLAMARALMSGAKLLLADEPSIGLAPIVIREMMTVLKQLRKRGVTILLAEQNAQEALRIADRGYVIELGRNTIAGYSDSLLNDERVRAAYLGGKIRV